MKHIFSAMLAVAICLLPIGAFAGEPSAPGPMAGVVADPQLSPQQHQAMMQIMQQTHQQLEQLHSQARNRILGELTPAHRALLAQVVGNLAIAANPDRDAAARQLDAALSPGEAQAILSTHNALKTQAKAIMDNSFKQTQAVLTPQQRSAMQNGPHFKVEMRSGMMGEHEGPGEEHETETAGSILLNLATMSDSHMDMMYMTHP